MSDMTTDFISSAAFILSGVSFLFNAWNLRDRYAQRVVRANVS